MLRRFVPFIYGLALFTALSASSVANAAGTSIKGEWAVDPLSRPFGLGVMAGEPTGLNAKYWLSEIGAIDAGLAWSFANETAFDIHADYLFHENNMLKLDEHPVQFYFGAGPHFKFETFNTVFGIRIPVGLAYMFSEQPIDLSVEVAPILNLAPSTEISLNASVAARYYF